MPRRSRPYFHPVKRRWRVRIDGRDVWAPPEIGPQDEPAAWAWLASLAASPVPVARAATVETLRRLYLSHLDSESAAGRRSRNAYNATRTHLRRFAAFRRLGATDAARLNVGHLSAFAREAGAEFSANYVRNIVKSVHAMLNWAATPTERRPPLIPANPLRGVPRPPVPRVNRYVDPATVRGFLRFCWRSARSERRDRRADGELAVLLLHFLRLTGARPGEACCLLWSDVDREAGVIVLPWDRHKTGRKTAEDRVIYLTPRSLALLRAVEIRGVRPDGFVFGHRKGPWNSVAFAKRVRSWRESYEASGINPYALRHAFATEAVLAGVSYADLGKILGNSPATIERHYDHPVRERLRERVRELDRALRKPS